MIKPHIDYPARKLQNIDVRVSTQEDNGEATAIRLSFDKGRIRIIEMLTVDDAEELAGQLDDALADARRIWKKEQHR